LQQSAKIKPRASGDNGQPASPDDAGDGFAGSSRVVSRGVKGIGVHHIEKVMRYQLPLLGRRLGGADLQATIHGHGVATDNLTLEAPAERDRFVTDVIPAKPNLVIWQVGTNAIWQRRDSDPPPPSFDETTSAIREGLITLQAKTEADVILMDVQYVPAVLTPAKKENAMAMVDAISRLAREAKVNVFRRFAFMKSLIDVEGVPLDRMVDPFDNDRLHGSDWVTGRVAWALQIAIADGVKKARASMIAKR